MSKGAWLSLEGRKVLARKYSETQHFAKWPRNWEKVHCESYDRPGQNSRYGQTNHLFLRLEEA